MTSNTKVCPICKTRPPKNLNRGGYCWECARAKGREDYQKHKERYYKHAKARFARMCVIINAYKDFPCKDCGVKYPPYVMDFDHLDPTIKVANITHMRRHRFKLTTIIDEIKKCDLVCANCHRERTQQRATTLKSKISFSDLEAT